MSRYIQEETATNLNVNAKVDPKRAKLPIFPSIRDGTGKTGFGAIFTTPGSSRIYVTSKASWGKQSQGRIAKGFPSDTPMSEIKNYSERTKVKHGTSNISRVEGKKEVSKGKHGFATKANPDKVKRFKRVA